MRFPVIIIKKIVILLFYRNIVSINALYLLTMFVYNVSKHLVEKSRVGADRFIFYSILNCQCEVTNKNVKQN